MPMPILAVPFHLPHNWNQHPNVTVRYSHCPEWSSMNNQSLTMLRMITKGKISQKVGFGAYCSPWWIHWVPLRCGNNQATLPCKFGRIPCWTVHCKRGHNFSDVRLGNIAHKVPVRAILQFRWGGRHWRWRIWEDRRSRSVEWSSCLLSWISQNLENCEALRSSSSRKTNPNWGSEGIVLEFRVRVEP